VIEAVFRIVAAILFLGIALGFAMCVAAGLMFGQVF
jgi:hypothetical protein